MLVLNFFLVPIVFQFSRRKKWLTNKILQGLWVAQAAVTERWPSKSSSYSPNVELKEAKQRVNPWLGGVSHFIAYRKGEGGGLERVKFVSRDI